MKPILFVVVVLVALVLALWIARDERAASGAITPGTELAPVATPARAEMPETDVDPLRTAEYPLERSADFAPAEALATPSIAATSGLAEIELVGTLVVVDEFDVEHAAEHGSLELTRWTGSAGSKEKVEVTAGRWSAKVPAAASLSVARLELAGRPADLIDAQPRWPVPADGRVDLRARWFRATSLRVLDADTRRDLRAVSIVRAEGWPRSELRHPGRQGDAADEQRVLHARVDSPVALSLAAERLSKVHVGAPDHAWTLVNLDALEGGERVVVLPPGAGLTVELRQGLVDPGQVLRGRGPDGLVFAELEVGDRRDFTLDGLLTGKTRVSVEIGDWWSEARVLAEGEVELVRGERAFLRLDVADAPSSPDVPFSGELIVPTEWALTSLLVIKLLDPPLGGREEIVRLHVDALERVAGRDSTWRWSLPNAQAGRYELELWPLHYSISVEVGPAGLRDLRFEIPPPGELLVRVLDAHTGESAEVETVLWNCARPEWVRGGGLARAEREVESGLWRIRAPQGRVELRTRGGGYVSASGTVELGALPQEYELRVEHEYVIRLFLRDGNTPVHWERGGSLSWRGAGTAGSRGVWNAIAELRVPVPAPGIYRLSIPELAAYEPVPEQEVLVGADGPVEHVIELVRRR